MLLTLTNTPRDYAWGSTTLLAELEGRAESGAPEAEVWFGDHPADPAEVSGAGTLDAVTGGTLPYLLKLLAAAAPLSIQVHPTIAQAQSGRMRETALAEDDPSRNYRDGNHKPELLVALSDRFEALSGLRPVARTRRLAALLGDAPGVEALRARLDGADDALRETIAWALSTATSEEIDDIIQAVDAAAAAVPESAPFAAELRAISAVAARNPGDAGVVVALLMNYVVLERGQGIFLRAGLLHAYLSGLGVEIMAASDNVLRGGLTPKHVDVPELLAIVDTTPGEVPVLRADAAAEVATYPVPVADFALSRVRAGEQPTEFAVAGPTMVLATAGEVRITAGGATLTVAVGTAAFVSADESSYTITGDGEAFIASPGS